MKPLNTLLLGLCLIGCTPAPSTSVELDQGPIDIDIEADGARPDAASAPCAEPTPCTEATREHHLRPLSHCGFALQLEGDLTQNQALADTLAAQAGGLRTIDELLLDLDRQARPGLTTPALERLEGHHPTGLRWDDGDHRTANWYPQGITGGDDAWPEGHAHRLLMVSWYDHGADGIVKGVRITLLDLTEPDDPRYRHLLLVVPQRTPTGVNFQSLRTDQGGSLHAGGIVWRHPWLYVADTTEGLRVFDLERIIAVPDTDDPTRIGVSAQRVDAHSYRYMVPQVARYRLAGRCGVRFSFVGLDRSETPPVLITGEYHRSDAQGRIVRWPLDPETGLLLTDPQGGGITTALDAAVSGQSHLQGALTWQGTTYTSASGQEGRLGRIYHTTPGQGPSQHIPWPNGCEDLYLERSTDHLWTATEFPNARDVVGVPRP
jgi:hypothetical protein